MFSLLKKAAMLAATVAFIPVDALYSANSPVQMLTAADFDKKVLNSNESWMVEFFASWCGHCKQFAPEYEKAAKALQGIVNFAAVEDESLMGRFQVQGFPTIKFFPADNKKAPKDYNQARSADAVVNFSLTEVKNIATSRLSGKKAGANNNNKKTAGGDSKDAVVVITADNFEELVMKDTKNAWFLEFYAPWCGHCKNLEPEWNRMAKSVQGQVKVGKIDATIEGALAQKFGVRGYPTLKMLPAGKKSVSGAVDYNGARTADALEEFALSHAPAIVVEAAQLLSQKQFEENCGSKLCVVALLPSIYESTAAERTKLIGELNAAAKSAGRTPVSFFWMQGGDNFDFEEQLALQFGFPALIAVHGQKGFAVHRGGFTSKAIGTFLAGMNTGRVSVAPLPKNLAKLETVKAWNGKDVSKDEL